MTDDEIKQIKALAREVVKNSGWTHVHYIEATARFQNAANPAAILSLIDRLWKAEAERVDLKWALTNLADQAYILAGDVGSYDENPIWDCIEKARAFVEEEEK